MTEITTTADGNPDGIASERQHAALRSMIGRGLAFPFRRDAFGAVALTSGDNVVEAIHMIVMTAPGERVMRPEFGCAIWDHVFDPINASTLGQMAHAVREALSRWEPRIEVDEVRVSPEPQRDSCITIDVHYTLRASNDHRNLVFPFYVLPSEEMP